MDKMPLMRTSVHWLIKAGSSDASSCSKLSAAAGARDGATSAVRFSGSDAVRR